MNPDFLALASESTRGAPLSPESQEFVRQAIVRWLAGGTTIDKAMGLGTGESGRRSAQSRLLLALRDGRIRDAALQLALPTRRAAAREIARRWSRLADGKAPADPVDNFLAPAVRLAGRLSAESIRNILGA